MKRKLLLFTLLLSSTFIIAQISTTNIDDFQAANDVGNWFEGGTSPNPPINIVGGGIAGASDNYLENSSSGITPDEAGSKMVMINNSQWIGDYTTAGIKSINFNARVVGANDLNIRLALQGPSGTRICSTNSVLVPAGGSWASYSIPVEEADFTYLQGGSTVAATLSGAIIARLLSSSTPSFTGETIAATLHIDNIQATTVVLGVEDNNITLFSLSPNPASSEMTIKLPVFKDDTKVEVYNVLGKKIFTQELNSLSEIINVSQWNSGIYLVRLTTNDASLTKRFIKQ